MTCKLTWSQPCGLMSLVSSPDPPRMCEKEGLAFWTTFLVKWGWVAPRAESSNQIAECIIRYIDVGNRARDLALQSEGKLLLQLICYVLGCSKVGCSLLEFCKACLVQWAICKFYSFGLTVAMYSPTLLLEADAGSRKRRCWRLAEQSYKRHSLVSSYTLHAMHGGMQ